MASPKDDGNEASRSVYGSEGTRMRAVLIATGEWRETGSLADWQPVPLIPLLDRPLIQHLVEFLARQGIRQYDFVLHHQPNKIEDHLEDGTRWGSKFIFHLVRDCVHPYERLPHLDLTTADNKPLLFGHADRMPLLNLAEIQARHASVAPLLFYWKDLDGNKQWSGWALLSPPHFAGLSTEVDEKAFYEHLQRLATSEQHWAEIPAPLNLSSFKDVLGAQRAVLEKRFADLFLTGREVEPGIWISRNVVLHPTAQVLAPAYLGENLQIGAMVTIGPNAVIGANSMIDRGSSVTNALVLPGSYIGQYLAVEDAILDRNRLLQSGPDGVTIIKDDFLFASLSDYAFGRALGGGLSRLTAFLLFVLFSPVLLGMLLARKLTGRPWVEKRSVVQTPAEADEITWREIGLCTLIDSSVAPPIHWGLHRNYRDLFMRFVPALWNVVRGQIRLVGLPPRTREEINSLPSEWRGLYLRCKSGLVTELAARGLADVTEDEIYASEAYYAALADWKYDLKLLTMYLLCTLFFIRPPRERVARSEQMFPDEQMVQ